MSNCIFNVSQMLYPHELHQCRLAPPPHMHNHTLYFSFCPAGSHINLTYYFYIGLFQEKYNENIQVMLVGWLCLTSHRQRGHLETATSYEVKHKRAIGKRTSQIMKIGQCVIIQMGSGTSCSE